MSDDKKIIAGTFAGIKPNESDLSKINLSQSVQVYESDIPDVALEMYRKSVIATTTYKAEQERRNQEASDLLKIIQKNC